MRRGSARATHQAHLALTPYNLTQPSISRPPCRSPGRGTCGWRCDARCSSGLGGSTGYRRRSCAAGERRLGTGPDGPDTKASRLFVAHLRGRSVWGFPDVEKKKPPTRSVRAGGEIYVLRLLRSSCSLRTHRPCDRPSHRPLGTLPRPSTARCCRRPQASSGRRRHLPTSRLRLHPRRQPSRPCRR